MNEYIKQIPSVQADITRLELQVRYLKSIKFKRKADGSKYKNRYMQSSVVIHEKTSYRNFYYFFLPKDQEYFTIDPKHTDAYRHRERYVLSDQYDDLEEEIAALIDGKEKAIEIKKDQIKKLLFLNDYLNQYLNIKRMYLDMIEKSREEIQKAMEELNPEYAVLPLGHHEPVSSVWDNNQHFSYNDD